MVASELRAGNILIADAQEMSRTLMAQLLESENYAIMKTDKGADSLDLLKKYNFDVLILDPDLNDMNGLELCRKLRSQMETESLPIIVLTTQEDTQSHVNAKEAGCTDFLNRPIDPTELTIRIRNVMDTYLYHKHLEQSTEQLEATVKKREANLRRAFYEVKRTQLEVINRLSRAAEFRDNESVEHVVRMSHYSELLARKAGLDDKTCELMLIASRLHDVGKIGIPDSILLKPGKLTSGEFETMKEHAEIGYRILHGSGIDFLELAASIALTHHEKFNGSGYPFGTVGKEIPIEGRICAITDVFDALSTKRVHKPAFPMEKTVRIMKEDSEKHFDPELLNLFFKSMDEILKIKSQFADRND